MLSFSAPKVSPHTGNATTKIHRTANGNAISKLRQSPSRPMNLTPREQEVYQLIVEEGISRQELADRLGIALQTVVRHIYSLLQKTGADSQLQMVVWHYTK